MKYFSTILFCLIGPFVFAQNYEISGRIFDQQSGEAIEYATIVLFSAADSSLIDGSVTDANGDFSFSKVANKPLYFTADFLGYQSYNSQVFMPREQSVFDDIRLRLNATDLTEVEVTGRAVTSVHKLDKQVYDAAQFENAKGGTAMDVMRNLPSVSINSFDQISVRGTTGFLVMINGKPVQGDPVIVLQQLSANSIDDIEIVTAPSAKFDPDGNAGIINVKTKQAISDGMFLVANVLAGLPSIEPYDNQEKAQRYGADLTFNYKKRKWDFSAGLDYRRYDKSGRRDGYVNTYLREVLTEFPSVGERSFNTLNYSARASLSYAVNKKQNITAGFFAGKRRKERTADILYENQQRTEIPVTSFLGTEAYFNLFSEKGSLYDGGKVLSRQTYFNDNLRVRNSDFFIASLDYALKLADNSNLKISGLYERTILGGPTNNSSLVYPIVGDTLQAQVNDNVNPLDGFRFQMDYDRSLGIHKWESGYQYRYLQHPGDFEYFDRDFDNNTWVANPLFTNSINLTRSIHSLYSQLSGTKNKLQYSAGLRLEYFDRTVSIARPDETFNLDQWNLFPSVNMAYSIREDLLFKAGYSRRIERMTTFKMTPFPEREHSETLDQGDAELLPEFIDLVEAGLVKNWEDNSAFATVYYRRLNNVVNRVNTVFNDTILGRVHTNVGVANALGLEMGTTLYPTKKWRFYLGGNIYNYRIAATLFEENVNRENWVYSINANTNYNFPQDISLQLAFNYVSRKISAQGEVSDFYNPSLSLRKSFFDKKLAIGLQWQSIDMGLWKANEQRKAAYGDEFYKSTNYIYEVDIIQFNLTYQLNQISKKINLPKSEFGEKEF